MSYLRTLIVFATFVLTVTSLSPPDWYHTVGRTTDYIAWCKNPECTKLLNKNIFSPDSALHSDEDLATWTNICKNIFNRLETAINSKHPKYKDITKSTKFCGFQQIEKDWYSENYDDDEAIIENEDSFNSRKTDVPTHHNMITSTLTGFTSSSTRSNSSSFSSKSGLPSTSSIKTTTVTPKATSIPKNASNKSRANRIIAQLSWFARMFLPFGGFYVGNQQTTKQGESET